MCIVERERNAYARDIDTLLADWTTSSDGEWWAIILGKHLHPCLSKGHP
jgi:hypothetical protein